MEGTVWGLGSPEEKLRNRRVVFICKGSSRFLLLLSTRTSRCLRVCFSSLGFSGNMPYDLLGTNKQMEINK